MGRDKVFETALWTSVVQIEEKALSLLDKIKGSVISIDNENREWFISNMRDVGLYYALLDKLVTRFRFDIGDDIGKFGISRVVKNIHTQYSDILTDRIDDLTKSQRVELRKSLNLMTFCTNFNIQDYHDLSDSVLKELNSDPSNEEIT